MIFGEDFEFEIYNHHRFGYNPEELNEIYHGRLSIGNKQQKQGVWEVSFSEQEVGFLTAKISSTPNVWPEWAEDEIPDQSAEKQPQFDSEPKSIKIKSIIASIPSIKNLEMWLELKVGKEVVKTIHKQLCPTSELIFLDEIQFYKPQTEYFLHFNLYTKENSEQQTSVYRPLVASAELLLPAE